MVMPLIDLNTLKVLLDIDPRNTGEDLKLGFLVELASDWIAEYLDRPGLFIASRTEFYKGTGTQKLLLNSRPVYTTPTIVVYQDEGGYYGSTTGSFNATTSVLTYGQDYGLQIDQSDGSSRSGILFRIRSVWPRPAVRSRGLLSPYIGEDFGSIKVTYTGGYTIDNLPSMFRQAVVLIVARLRQLLPLGQIIQAESYEERAISYGNLFGGGGGGSSTGTKEFIMNLARPLIFSFKNWRF